MKKFFLLSPLFLLACGGVYEPAPDASPREDAQAEASPDAAVDASPDAASDAPACTMVCDPAIGWYDECSQTIIGCADGGTECCDKQAPGCGCADFGVGGYFCKNAYQGDSLSCQKCGRHCEGGL